MTPGRRAALEVAIAALILGGAFVAGLLVGAKHQDAKAAAAQTQVDQLKGEALAAGQAAHQADQQAMKDQATVTAADALARAAKRELDRRLAALHGDAPASHPSPGSPRATGAGRGNLPEIPDSSPLPSLPASHPDHSGDATEMVQPLPAVPAAQDELTLTRAALAQAQAVIAAQGDQLAARDRLIASLTASRDAWKADAEASQKALALERIAAESQASAQAKRTVWGEIKAGAASALIGYAIGRSR